MKVFSFCIKKILIPMYCIQSKRWERSRNEMKGFVCCNTHCYQASMVARASIKFYRKTFLIPKHSFIDPEFHAIVAILTPCSGIQYFRWETLHGSLPHIRHLFVPVQSNNKLQNGKDHFFPNIWFNLWGGNCSNSLSFYY